MKKMTVALMLLIIAALGMNALAVEIADVTGTWVLDHADMQGVVFDGAMLGFMGIDLTMTLSEDGTATIKAMEETIQGTWTIDGNVITVDMDGIQEFTLTEDGMLMTDMDGEGTLYLSRTGSQTPPEGSGSEGAEPSIEHKDRSQPEDAIWVMARDGFRA